MANNQVVESPHLPYSLIELSNVIAANARAYADNVNSNGESHSSNDFESLEAVRHSLISAAFKIITVAARPTEYLPNVAIQIQHIACLKWLCHFKIPDCVPIDGSLTYGELAESAKVPIDTLRRIVRGAMIYGFFQEPSPGFLVHTPTSVQFLSQPHLYDFAYSMYDGLAPASLKMAEATERWGGSQEKNHTAFNVATHSDKPYFAYLGSKESGEMGKRFPGYMRALAESEDTNMKHLVNGYDWAGLGEATVVDVGGSTGHVAYALANAFSNLSIVVQDLQSVIESRDMTVEKPSVTFVAHDFFTPQPFTKANILLLRTVIHDWGDKDAEKIIGQLIPAMENGARLVIMDTVLPDVPGSISPYREAMLRRRDITMMQFFNSREREYGEWIELLRRVDDRLRIMAKVEPHGSVMAIMEVVLNMNLSG